MKPLILKKITKGNNYIKDAERIYNSFPVRFERKYFYEALTNFNKKYNYAVLKNGQFVGFMCVGKKINKWFSPATEIFLDKEIDILKVVKCYFEKFKKKNIFLMLFPSQSEYIKCASSVCAQLHDISEASFLILNYKNTLAKFLNYYESPNSSYSVTVDFSNGEKLQITANDGNVSVEDFDGEADIIIPEKNASAIIFSPYLAKIYGLPFSFPVGIPFRDKV